MPIGSQSSTPWAPTTYPSMTASTLKASIDTNSSIAANTAGALYVYPKTPAAMSVWVDPAFNLPQVGASTPVLFNGAAAPVLVPVVAPVSNSYYACIYWDVTTSSAGVIYGAIAVSPTPLFPDNSWRIPLAFVLLTTGQSTVVGSNIFDARIWVPCRPLVFISSGLSVNTNFYCTGASALYHAVTYTAAITMIYNALPVGIPVNIDVQNTSGSAQILKIAAQAPSGQNYVSQTKQAGTSTTSWTDLTVSGVSILAGAIWKFSGWTGLTSALIPALTTVYG